MVKVRRGMSAGQGEASQETANLVVYRLHYGHELLRSARREQKRQRR